MGPGPRRTESADPAADQHGMWERIAESFDATRTQVWPPVTAFLEELGAERPGARVLDLMAGNGRHTVRAAAAGLDPVWLDWSRTMARRLAEQKRLGGLPCIVGDATRLPFSDGSFDGAVFVAGLHGIPDATGRAACLRELCRVLRPGAPALVTVWSRHAPRFQDLEGTAPVLVEVPWRAAGHEEQRTYTLHDAPSLARELEAAGLVVERLEAVALASEAPDNLMAQVRPRPS